MPTDFMISLFHDSIWIYNYNTRPFQRVASATESSERSTNLGNLQIRRLGRESDASV